MAMAYCEISEMATLKQQSIASVNTTYSGVEKDVLEVTSSQ